MTGAELAEGLSFGLPDDLITAFAVFGITGVGAAELIFYPIWCLEKGYAKATGPRDDSPEWYERARGWMRVMKYDAWFSMAIYTVGTLSFYVLGASILHRRGATVGNKGAIDTLASMYVHTIGPSGTLDLLSRGVHGAVLDSIRLVRIEREVVRRYRRVGGRVSLPDAGRPDANRALCRHWDSYRGHARLPAFRVARDARPDRRVAQAMMLPFLAGAAVYFHHFHMPPGLRSSGVGTVLLWIAFIAMSGLGVFQAWRLMS